jgi:molybdopterin converting factor subunit 1
MRFAHPMTVRVRLFAVARELAVRDELSIELRGGQTVADLRRALVETVPALARVLPHSLLAVDAQYANDATSVDEHSEIALIPPVSGG